jgi:hypothetical protein
MAETDATPQPTSGHRPRTEFRRLPEPVRLEDTVTSHDADAPPDPEAGRDTDRDFLLRYFA